MPLPSVVLALRSSVSSAGARRQKPQRLAILGDRAARDPKPLLVQDLRDALIAQRLALVLVVDQSEDLVLRDLGRDVVPLFRREAAREEIFQLEDAARSLD